ncbi:LytR/AlgR family response regulator transcription factor [Flavobacterium sp. HJJ]|uniref:LytR/AlgR family response regulator transcription factor n=1 Tax=Flavobacterium sp. HJJ TaxID=2783792 RepID=UPI00188D17A4|nr:LytTR family DNA-binding domain-containing protein [Flavobacterium sp. HJJ]MBF4472126.1 response regulator [Flavobacterium sp. HJJ]
MKIKNLQPPVQIKEIAFFGIAFFCFVISYHLTLWIYLVTTNQPYDIKDFLNWGGIDHFCKLLLGIPRFEERLLVEIIVDEMLLNEPVPPHILQSIVENAVKIINEFKPELFFIDVQMPNMNGFEVLAYLKKLPQIIFSTAYDQYALKAFEVHALDYLLKTYTRHRFQHAQKRLSIENADHIVSLFKKNMLGQAKYPERIIVQSGKKYVTITTENIQRIEAWDDYSRLHKGDHTYISNFGISQLVKKFNPDIFIRIHRSAMINVHSIKEINKLPRGYDVFY